MYLIRIILHSKYRVTRKIGTFVHCKAVQCTAVINTLLVKLTASKSLLTITLVTYIPFFGLSTVVPPCVLSRTKKLPVCNVWRDNGKPDETHT